MFLLKLTLQGQRYPKDFKDWSNIQELICVPSFIEQSMMELLTSRLTVMMNQVSENRMMDIIDQDRFEKQRMIERQQRSRMLLYNTNDPFYNIQEQRQASVDRRATRNKKKEEQAKPKDAEDSKVKKISTLVTIWGNRPSREQKGSIKDDNIEKPKGPNKFLKAAKMAAVISSVKFGRDICTCSSLDAKCAVHDN